MYSGLPHVVNVLSNTTFAKPKSTTTTYPAAAKVKHDLIKQISNNECKSVYVPIFDEESKLRSRTVDEDILWLQISVANVSRMQMTKSLKEASTIKGCRVI